MGVDGCQLLADDSDQFVDGIVQPSLNGRGCNEVNGTPDTHGSTSGLTEAQIADLEAFVLSIE